VIQFEACELCFLVIPNTYKLIKVSGLAPSKLCTVTRLK